MRGHGYITIALIKIKLKLFFGIFNLQTTSINYRFQNKGLTIIFIKVNILQYLYR